MPIDRNIFLSSRVRKSSLLDRMTEIIMCVSIFLFALMVFILWARWFQAAVF